jgi:hypothetical protein
MHKLRRDLNSLRSWVADLDRDVADNRAERLAQTHLLNALGQTQSDQNRTIRGLAEQVGRLTVGQAELSGRVDALHGTVEAVDGKVNAIGGTVGVIGDKVAGIGDEVAGIDGKVAGIDGKVAGIDGKVAGIDGKVDALTDRVVGLEHRFDGLAASVAEVLRRLPNPAPAAPNS